jgi:GNAT superfamily N-acetyltransferase
MIRSYQSKDLADVTKIFWETSSLRDFTSEEKKRSFIYKYLGFYLENSFARNWVAENDGRILGYLLSLDKPSEKLNELNPLLATFSDLWKTFPAHLHVNVSAQSQGHGLGSLLLQKLEEESRLNQLSGIHLITAPKSRNIPFYQRNGYTFEAERNQMLFLGKRL